MSTTSSNFIGVIPHQLRKYKNIGDLEIEKTVYGGDSPTRAGKIKDLVRGDHIIIYPSSNIWLSNYSNLKCKVSLIIAEPQVVHRHYYAMLWLLRLKFYRIFTHFTDLDKKYDNVISEPIANSWVSCSTEYNLSDKNNIVSLIASNKNKYKGHKLRHEIVNQIQNLDITTVDLLGRAYNSFDNKEDGLLPYKFSIVIENSQEKDYFTEKLLDCFICGTIPIYWGAHNIGDYFDINGMIVFNSTDELLNILQNISERSYVAMSKFTQNNKNIACSLSDANIRIINKLRKSTD